MGLPLKNHVQNHVIFSDPIQINGMKLLDNLSGAGMQHMMALERRAINLWGEAISKTVPFRMKKTCLFNVSTSSGPFAPGTLRNFND